MTANATLRRSGLIDAYDITVGVIDHQGEPVKWEGLLGMNFLHMSDYQLDFEKKAIYWNR